MQRSIPVRVCVLLASLAWTAGASAQQPKTKSHRIPPADLKKQVIWGSVAESPEGVALSFGGQDQKSEFGHPRTWIRKAGKWDAIGPDLTQSNRLALSSAIMEAYRDNAAQYAAHVRRAWFDGVPFQESADILSLRVLRLGLPDDIESLEKDAKELDPVRAALVRDVIKRYLEPLGPHLTALEEELAKSKRVSPSWIVLWGKVQMGFEQASLALGSEPPPRALSPLVYEPKSKRFVLFGGDHLDYLTNDLWVFDPAAPRWETRRAENAPPPRASHTLKATGDGKITLKGGYTYTSSTEYLGAQYRELDDGEWTYDVKENTWSGPEAGVPSDSRTYRTGALYPAFYLEGPPPDPSAVTKTLAELPANRWVKMNPPQLPKLNRDWGTAVLDPDHDLILRFSGGHSAHGGTDVLHYHLATNRWELCFPVEFPLGQLYSNTEYPEGFNFNLRPWVTGHTYQNYTYDPTAKRMLFAGREDHTYFYNPAIGDWGEAAFPPDGNRQRRVAKPKGMDYDSCFYDLTLCPTPLGAICWTKDGRVFRHDAKASQWRELVPSTAEVKLPGAVVDNSTVVYDTKRDRLVFARKPYGDKIPFEGQLHAMDLKTLAVSALTPEGKDLAAEIPYLCQIRYDQEHDLFLCGCTLPAAAGQLRRTPVYDPAANRWKSLAITGDDPSPKGRNVSLGMQYDPKRKLFWAVDTNSQVFVLKLDPKK